MEFIETPEQRAERIAKSLEFAAKYAHSFDRHLLDHWYRAFVERTAPINASHVELAADNALRQFVVGIVRQYQLATTGSPDTPWPQQQTSHSKPPKQPKQPRQRKQR